MERSRSHCNYILGDERTSTADLGRVRGRLRGPGRNAKLHGLGGSPLSAGRSPTPATDFLSPHPQNAMLSPAGASPAPSAGHRERREKIRAQRRLRNQNPFYDHAQFRQYRTRQEQKEEKDGQKWPPILEDPFLDALLLIPDMGRSKYFMHGSLYGRNMIISTYVWMAYCKSLPPRATPNAVNRRDRKAISSHIQVLKNFFKEHRFFHFFFPTKDEEQKRGTKDDGKSVESQSLKTNPVLMALSAGRFPDVRPNYEYFAHLLEQSSTVSVHPKTCCVFVSSPGAHIDEAKTDVHTEDPMNISPYYPLPKAGGEGNPGMAHSPDASEPLHKFTSSVSQTYSGSVKEITKHWEASFPELCDSLNLPEPQDEDSLTILEMNVTLELHKEHFPSGSELNTQVEMSIAQPSLQSHQWKCVTRLVRPQELCTEPGSENTVLELTDEVDVQFAHQAGCGDAEDGCHCMAKPRHDIRVPFPAAEWASMLTNCASYPESEPQRTKRRRGAGIKLESDDEFGTAEPTQKELLAQIGMLQELWSCGPPPPSSSSSSFSPSPTSSHSLCGDDGVWTRRAIVFWKFRDVHQYNAKKKKWVAEEPTTHWRFLTVNDPTSEYHMQNAYVSREAVEGVDPALGGGAFVSPRAFNEYHHQQQQQMYQSQHQHQHRAAAATASDNFLAWNMNASISNHMRSLSAPTGSLDLADMSGILPELPGSSYPSSLESSSHAAALGGHFGGGLLQSSCTTSTGSRDGSFVEDAGPPTTDLFADSLAMVSSGLMYDEECCDPALQTWETDLKSWVPASEFDASLTSSDGTPEWGGWAAGGEDGWAPPLHMSLRPEWDEVKDEGLLSSCGTPGMGDAGMADMGMGKAVLGKRGREVEAERSARRVRRELRVVGRA